MRQKIERLKDKMCSLKLWVLYIMLREEGFKLYLDTLSMEIFANAIKNSKEGKYDEYNIIG